MRTIVKAVPGKTISPGHSALTLSRVIGTVDIDGRGSLHDIAQVDPFILLDEARIEGEMASSFAKHPHTGLTAVTYLLEGVVHAWDNIHGATPDLHHAGGVYCVDSGRGIVHGEAPVEGLRRVRLLQLWFNPGLDKQPLPAASYQLFQPAAIPVYQNETIWAKIIIGSAFGCVSPVMTRWPIQYLHIKLAAFQGYTLTIAEPSWQGFIYVLDGQGHFGDNAVTGSVGQCLILGDELSTSLAVQNTSDTALEFILATGKAHNKPFAKLLGHGGALVADTADSARKWMLQYEKDPEHFGCEPR